MPNLIPQIYAESQSLGGSFTGVGGFQFITPSQSPEIITNIASTMFGFLTTVAGLAFMLYFILGAISWITSSGDQQKLDKAKSQMTSAAVGLIIVVASYIIIGIVGQVLGIDILLRHPYELIQNIGAPPQQP